MRTAQCQYQQCAISNTSFQGYPPRRRPKIHSAENKMNIGNVVGDHFVQMCANQKKSYSVCAQAMDAKSQNSFLEAISDFHSMNMCISSPTSTFNAPLCISIRMLIPLPLMHNILKRSCTLSPIQYTKLLRPHVAYTLDTMTDAYMNADVKKCASKTMIFQT